MYTFYFEVVNTLGPGERFKLVATDVPENPFVTLGTFYSRGEIESLVRNNFRIVIEPAQFVTTERREKALQMRILPGHTFEPVGVRKSS